MGLALSCPEEDAVDDSFQALLMKSIDFIFDDNVKSNVRTIGVNGHDSEPALLKGFSSKETIIDGSLSLKKEDSGSIQLEAKISKKSPPHETDGPLEPSFEASRISPSRKRGLELPIVDPDCSMHRAAVKLQKVYKSFRTRRQLADCAVIVEQEWWKVLDFALLKRSSVSYFDIDEPESAVSRWFRARRRAAKVGKGSSKDEKARKLALQHWLEAIDPRHRYGHNLQFYYDCWIRCESKEPFFYWLDLGEGKEANLDEQCPRSRLQQQCIKYLGPKEREVYEVIVEDGKFIYKQSKELLDTSENPKDSKWIFVLSTLKRLYVGQKKKGMFQHSSFLAGGATSSAGRLVIENGILKAVWPHSGHYRPTEENFQEFMNFLKEKNVDLTDVQLSPTEEIEEVRGLRSLLSELDLTKAKISAVENEVERSCASCGTRITIISKSTASYEPSKEWNQYISTKPKVKSQRRAKYQKLPKRTRQKKLEDSDNESQRKLSCSSEPKKIKQSEKTDVLECSLSADSQSEGCETAEDSSTSGGDTTFCKKSLFLEEQEEDEEVSVSKEKILLRINSKKGMDSYQLGKQLSFKWTTGAGPRIGCVRDYPSELRFRALEQVHLSSSTHRPCPAAQACPSPQIYTLPCSSSIHSSRMAEASLLHKVPLLHKPKLHR